MAGRGAPHPGEPGAGHPAVAGRGVAGTGGLPGRLLAHVGARGIPTVAAAAAIPLAAARERALAGVARPPGRRRARHPAGGALQRRAPATRRARQDAAGEGANRRQRGVQHRRGTVHRTRQVSSVFSKFS